MAVRLSAHKPFPFSLLNVVLVVTFGLLVGAGVLVGNGYRAMHAQEAQVHELGVILQRLVFLEEQLLLYRRFTLDTQSERWLPDYEVTEQELSALLDEAIAHAPGPYARAGAQAMRAARDTLAGLERRAFALAFEGDTAGTERIFGSPSFQTAVEHYDAGFNRLATGMQPNVRLSWLRQRFQALAEQVDGWAWHRIESELPGNGRATGRSAIHLQSLEAELADLVPDLARSPVYETFREAYAAMQALEQQALRRADADDAEGAMELLDSEAYAAAQRRLDAATASFLDVLAQRIEQRRTAHQQVNTIIALLFGVGLVLLGGLWWYVLRLVRRHLDGRTRAEEALAQSERRHRALLGALPDVILALDADGTVLDYHTVAEPDFIVRYPVRQQHLEVVAPAAAAAVLAAAAAAVAVQQMQTIEFHLERPDGSVAYFEARVAPEGPARSVALVRDVTEQKAVEAELIRAKEEAEEAMQTKTAFLANMSHEIRTPLTGILGFATVLEEEVPEPHREFSRMIRRSGERLLHSINALLDLSQLEAQGMQVEPVPLDVAAEVAEAVRLLAPLAEQKGLACTFESPHETFSATLDPHALNLILNNLVGNAIKFTEAGRIHVCVYGDERVVRIEVADTGRGIDGAFLPHLFKEFRQERAHEGSGLGLAITKRLVDLLGGRIDVATRKGAGSTFVVLFPRQPEWGPV